MEDNYLTVELPRTAREWRDGDPAAVEECLLEELSEQASNLLTNTAMESGGAPDDEDVQIGRLKVGDERLKVTITVYFVEIIPSSCSDLPHRERRQVDLSLTMERGDDFAILDHPDSSPTLWDTLDQNSAADGR